MKIGDTVFQNKRYTRQNAKLISISVDKLTGTVMFDNGIIRHNVILKDFYEGTLDVSINNLLVGDEKEQRYGNIATITKIYGSNCDVMLEDGTIKTNARLVSFRKGVLGVSSCTSVRHKEKVGLSKSQRCGFNAKILKYDSLSKMCDVEFENGIKRYNVPYARFLSGTVNLPKSIVGKKKLQKCGIVAEIIKDYGNGIIDIQFENGEKRSKMHYSTFMRGTISVKSKCLFVGQKILQNCGMVAEIVELLPEYKCTVRFENGVVREGVHRNSFRDGRLTIKYTGKDLIGLEVNYNNIKGLVVGYSQSKDCVKVLLDTGIFCKIDRQGFISNNFIINNTDWNMTVQGFKYRVYREDGKYKVVFEDDSTVILSLLDLDKRSKVLPDCVKYISVNTYDVKGVVGNILSVYFDSVKKRYMVLVANKHMRRLVIL